MSSTENISRIDCATQIEEDNNLLALPNAVAKIIELTGGKEDVSIEKLSEIISTDAALTGRLLKIANSPFYGLSNRITSVHQGTMVLGMTTVKCLALSAAIFDPSIIPPEAQIDLKAYYGNIISVATTCRKLASECNYRAPEEAFTCGLLHDIGTLYFIHHYPDLYNQALINAAKSGSLLDEEAAIFGVSHTDVSKLIAQKWRLPETIISALDHQYNCGNKDSKLLDDILRLSVALNREMISSSDLYIEDKIAKITIITRRLNLSLETLDRVASTTMQEAMEFATLIDVNIGNYESILTRANQEIFKTYMSIQTLFKQRQELTGRILSEERERGLLEAKQIAVSTLAHYINNASMQISGQSQMARMALKKKTPEEIASGLPGILDNIDDAIKRTVAVLQEISEINMLDDVEYFDRSKIMNIDERIQARLRDLKNESQSIPILKS